MTFPEQILSGSEVFMSNWKMTESVVQCISASIVNSRFRSVEFLKESRWRKLRKGNGKCVGIVARGSGGMDWMSFFSSMFPRCAREDEAWKAEAVLERTSKRWAFCGFWYRHAHAQAGSRNNEYGRVLNMMRKNLKIWVKNPLILRVTDCFGFFY